MTSHMDKIKDREELRHLLQMFMEGNTTIEQESLLAEYFRNNEIDAEFSVYKDMFTVFESGELVSCDDEIVLKKEDMTFGKQPRFFRHVLRFTAVAASIILVFFIANIHSEHKISEKKNSNLQVLSQAQKPLVDNEICPAIISDEEIDAIRDEVDRHFELMTKEMNKFEQELQN